jgi:hypothetical protein
MPVRANEDAPVLTSSSSAPLPQVSARTSKPPRMRFLPERVGEERNGLAISEQFADAPIGKRRVDARVRRSGLEDSKLCGVEQVRVRGSMMATVHSPVTSVRRRLAIAFARRSSSA